MPTYQAPLCMTCKHFNFENKVNNVCTAFPDGIPVNILITELDHRKPVNGDHGIQYESVDIQKTNN